MEKIETTLKDCYIFKPKIINDSRGYFFESYNAQSFRQLIGREINFVQDNQSSSSYGVVRGLHFQKGEHAQAKLVRVLEGVVLDVAVDLRKDSPTFGKYFSVLLSGENFLQFFIPRGFAHGFSVLSPIAIFTYKCDNFYNKASEVGFRYNDSLVNIDWKIPADKVLLSEKDTQLPYLEDLEL
ncbi:MAG: dTDP-4-dehydrorhamnose 3,5-epimerase [Chitinophagaceae bacterium]|jgi:dTDP-4-dehydrorhamnose 3,5-epimerase|nr:dTDP-4-dehydrorhamnose 3,5-epimerase [Chitinophagaceae bacterium]